jgi:hypothetical protein
LRERGNYLALGVHLCIQQATCVIRHSENRGEGSRHMAAISGITNGIVQIASTAAHFGAIWQLHSKLLNC